MESIPLRIAHTSNYTISKSDFAASLHLFIPRAQLCSKNKTKYLFYAIWRPQWCVNKQFKGWLKSLMFMNITAHYQMCRIPSFAVCCVIWLTLVSVKNKSHTCRKQHVQQILMKIRSLFQSWKTDMDNCVHYTVRSLWTKYVDTWYLIVHVFPVCLHFSKSTHPHSLLNHWICWSSQRFFNLPYR